MSTGTRELTPKVEHCLRNTPRTRDDDFALYYAVATMYLPKGLASTISFRDLMLNAGKYGIPAFGSVTRVRRLLQSENEELRGLQYNNRKRMEGEFRSEFGR